MQELTHEIARQRQQELRRRAFRPAGTAPRRPLSVLVRPAGHADEPVLRALAELEGVAFVPGTYLCAEADGFVTAALRLEDGAVLASPFARTVELRSVLQLWARQLSGRRARRRWLPA